MKILKALYNKKFCACYWSKSGKRYSVYTGNGKRYIYDEDYKLINKTDWLCEAEEYIQNLDD